MLEAAVHPLWGSLALDRAARVSLQDQIVNYFRDAILSGRMPAGRRVPSSRQLASEHGISRMTAIEAYERLTSEGYLFSKDRAGLFVCNALPEDFFLPAPARQAAPARGGDLTAPPFDPYWHRLPLTPWMPAVDQFPWKDWSRLTAQVLRERPMEALHYGDPRGELPLRSAIAEYLGMTRGIDCTPDQIVIVSGSKHGVGMAARLLGKRGDEAWFEEPGHTVCRNLMESAGLLPVSIPIDNKGLDVAEAKQRAPNARLALISPSHQLPMGVTMSLDRRLEMLQWADRADAWIIEDDHDGEYCYSGRPVPPLYTLDRSGRVIYIGSFSNLFAPGLRLGYMVVPNALVRGFLEMHAALVPTLTQLVVARFISSGRLSSHLRRMRKLHSQRRTLLLEAIERHAGDVLRVGTAQEAGIRLLARLVPSCDDAAIAQRAVEDRVHVHPLSRCYAGNERERGFIIGFASTAESEIEPAVRRLAEIVRQAA
jgi:GntR family transcriptional regulator/MocR family aminotransferase